MKRIALPSAAICVALVIVACPLIHRSRDHLNLNMACYVCHTTFVREELTIAHLNEEIGCTRCHGASAAHANDENVGATRPDIVVWGEAINVLCRDCHEQHEAAPERMIARWLERGGLTAPPKAIAASFECNKCHNHSAVAPEKIVRRWYERTKLMSASQIAATTVTCTSCHGDHKIVRQGL